MFVDDGPMPRRRLDLVSKGIDDGPIGPGERCAPKVVGRFARDECGDGGRRITHPHTQHCFEKIHHPLRTDLVDDSAAVLEPQLDRRSTFLHEEGHVRDRYSRRQNLLRCGSSREFWSREFLVGEHERDVGHSNTGRSGIANHRAEGIAAMWQGLGDPAGRLLEQSTE